MLAVPLLCLQWMSYNRYTLSPKPVDYFIYTPLQTYSLISYPLLSCELYVHKLKALYFTNTVISCHMIHGDTQFE